MDRQFLIAGFGGQGVLLIGQLIAKTAMYEGSNVSWMPSYGPEMRGGEANCAVVVSDEAIGSPVVTEPPCLIAMNTPSLVKFMPRMEKNGILIYNSSLINDVEVRDDLKVVAVPCNEIAGEIGNPRVGNMVMLGAVVGATKVVTLDALTKTLSDWLGEKKAHMLADNMKAIERGMALVD